MLLPVLEVGGTHVCAAVVHADSGANRDARLWRLVGPSARLALDPRASATEILAAFTAVTDRVPAPPGHVTWGVAMPDPFDYARGIALFDGVGKFDALHGIDVGAALRAHLRAEVCFLNDADAFALGEWTAGAAVGSSRCAGLTLGTGIGTGWVVDGRVVDAAPGLPPAGRAHRLRIGGMPLEDVVSRRAIRAAYAASTGDTGADVAQIAALARTGDLPATVVLTRAFGALGRAVGPAVVGFGAEVLVVGGAMSASWDLFEPWFRAGAPPHLPPIRVTADAELAPLVGAARFVLSRSR